MGDNLIWSINPSMEEFRWSMELHSLGSVTVCSQPCLSEYLMCHRRFVMVLKRHPAPLGGFTLRGWYVRIPKADRSWSWGKEQFLSLQFHHNISAWTGCDTSFYSFSLLTTRDNGRTLIGLRRHRFYSLASVDDITYSDLATGLNYCGDPWCEKD